MVTRSTEICRSENMRLKESLLSRRDLLSGLICGSIGSLAGYIFYPVAEFLFHKKKMPLPKAVTVPMAEIDKLVPNTAVYFKYGRLPGILLKTSEGELRAFSAKCTHLDCNIKYLQDSKKFYCACHEGYFNDKGVNIAGPPPRPLAVFKIEQDGDQLLMSMKENTIESA